MTPDNRTTLVTPKNLEPEPKNPIIANFFHQVRLADELGSGVRNLYHYVKIYSNAEPVFDEDDVFRLVVPLNDEYSADRAFERELPQTKTSQESVVKDVVKNVVKKSDQIIACLKENPSATRQQLAAATGLTVRGVERNLMVLKQRGRLRRVGPDKDGHWEVIG